MTDPAKVPKVKLSNGFEIPIFGLGTWKENVEQSVKDAIDLGYRHFDTAQAYENEVETGKAIRDKIAEGVVKREDVFITSKLWSTYHSKNLVLPSLKESLNKLGLDYLDMFLIHSPVALKEGGEIYPRDADGNWQLSDVDYIESWKAMEECVRLGLVRSIGLSSFNTEQINRILDIATIKPVMNQVESHPFLSQDKLIEFCKGKGIAITAFSPLGSPSSPAVKETDPNCINEPRLTEIGEKYGKSSVQVALKWQVQRGIIAIPRSSSKNRIGDNINIFDFTLSDEDMKKINGMNINARLHGMSVWKDSKYYPFNIPV